MSRCCWISFLAFWPFLHVLAQAKKSNTPNEEEQRKRAALEMMRQIKEVLGKNDYHQRVKFINEDGVTGYELETSKKTSFESDAFWKSPVDTLSYLYEFPKPYKDSIDARGRGTISFYPPGGENILSAFNWAKVIQQRGDTLIIPFDTATSRNPYGKRFDWTHPGNFKNYARAWVFASTMRPVAYRSNRKGKWTLNRNVLSFIAEPNQNEFNFELKYLRVNTPVKELAGRPVTYAKEIVVESDTVFLELKDDQEEDGDMVSLYFDQTWVGKNISVTRSPIRFYLPITSAPEGSYFILHAENEGRIPPNTAEITIFSKDKRYNLTLASTRLSSTGILLKRRR